MIPLVTALLLSVQGPLAPDTVLTPPAGPRIVMLGATGEGVAALRVSVPLQEGPVEAGAGELLRTLALARMKGLAEPVGARVWASRTPWGLAYEVEGAAADFEYLAYLLRVAVAEPDTSTAALEAARQRLQETQAQARETPGGRVAAELRARLAPDALPLEGDPASLPGLDAARLRQVWRRSHQASAMTLVVSSPLAPEVVLAATRGMGAPEAAAAPPPDAPALPGRALPDVQTLRAWYGEAFDTGPDRDPVARVTALLVGDALGARSGSYETGVELWDLPHRSVLVLTGAAYPRNAGDMRRAVSGTLDAVQATVDADAVRDAVARTRLEVLLGARTAGGLVDVVGRAMEPRGDPRAAQQHLDALTAVSLADVTALLNRMKAAGPARAEVRP
jgi:predicted Zn-dependent peptidase